jgi:hypothetical protein
MPSARFRALPQDAYVPDYIHMAQAVLGKLGYGFVSECLTMGTALIYVPRQDWPEERYLEVSSTSFSPCNCDNTGYLPLLLTIFIDTLD